MTDLFEVMGMGDVAIKIIDGSAIVCYLGEPEQIEEDEVSIPIHERVFANLPDFLVWIESYAKPKFEKVSESVARDLKRKPR